MMFYNQTHHFLSKKFKNFFFEKIPQNQFYCIFKKEFFKFSKFFVNRVPSTRGKSLLGPSVPKRGSIPPTLAEKNLGDDTEKSPRTGFSQCCKRHTHPLLEILCTQNFDLFLTQPGQPNLLSRCAGHLSPCNVEGFKPK